MSDEKQYCDGNGYCVKNIRSGLNPDAIADVVAAAENVNDCFGVGYKNVGHLYIAIKPFMDELRAALAKLEAQS